MITRIAEFDWTNQRVKVVLTENGIHSICWIPMNEIYINPVETEYGARSERTNQN